MILICGIPSEPPLRYVIEAAEKARLPHLVLNQRDSHHTEMTLSVAAGRVGGCLQIGGNCYPLESFSGVYFRLMEWQSLPENQATRFYTPEPALREKSRLLAEAFVEWTEMADCRVLNRVSATASNCSKPYQAQLINACGLPTPPTLITNNPAEALEFKALHGRIIYKSISSTRSIVRELSDADAPQMEKIRALPTQFQAFIPGANVRVHVVGAEVFASEITTEAIDYRYAGRDDLEVAMRPVELPPETAAKCVQLSQRLELPLCGIDLKRTPAGEYYCFEVNPSPAYSYYQNHTGQPIAQAIAGWLAQG
jgi:glutathione synthase/RimK-type ligase-like ATP-grasp enzyme